jgi:Fe-S-cluster containining protein
VSSLRRLSPGDRLPLTCTRSGTCCHGKDIPITPYELAVLAQACASGVRAFRETHTTAGGTRLRCAGPPGWRSLPACSLYDPASGCRVHAARPLACRLYPLGRELAGTRERIVHEGRTFPCLDGCPEVAALPQLTVAAYLEQQGCAPIAAARDATLELAQDCAEGAFVLVFDSGLAASGHPWLAAWRRCVAAADRVPLMLPGWHDRLTAPELAASLDEGVSWVAAHAAAIQAEAQSAFATLRDPEELTAASGTMLAAALLLVHAVGGDANEVGARWLAKARR